MILITHDLGVARGRCDDVAVMYGGRLVERAPTETLFADSRHPYTEALLRTIPRIISRATPGSSRSPAAHRSSSIRLRSAPSRLAAVTPSPTASRQSHRSVA